MNARFAVGASWSLPGIIALTGLGAITGCASPGKHNIRTQLESVYDAYTTAYVAEDLETVQSMIGPDFHGRTLEGESFEREGFLDIVRTRMDRADFKSFDITILDIEKEGKTWVATVREDFVSTASHGHGDAITITEMYVTRDAWEPKNGRWLAKSSEVVEQADVLFNGTIREEYIRSVREASKKQ